MPRPEVRGSSRAYVAPSPYSLRVETRLVDVGVVVRDPQGRAVPGLKQSDFQVLDDGKERAITSFGIDTRPAGKSAAPAQTAAGSASAAAPPAVAPRPPRFVLLFFDDVDTAAGDLTHAQIAARRFVREGLSPGDRVAVLTSSSAHSLEFTTNVAEILDTIGRLKAHPRVPEAGLGACPRITPYQAYLISAKLDGMALKAAVDEVFGCAEEETPPNLQVKGMNNSPIIQTVKAQADQTWNMVRTVSASTLEAVDFGVEHLSKMPGSRMLVLVSSGFLAGTMERQQELVVDHALRAGVVINALDAKGLYSEPAARPLNERSNTTMAAMPLSTFVFEITAVGGRLDELGSAMANFATSTGGLFFHNNNDLDLAFRQIGVEPEVAYHLGFSPDDLAADGKYHKLKVRLVGEKTNIVQARPGYFAPDRAVPAEKAAPAGQKASAGEVRARLDRAVMNEEILAAFPVSVSVKPGPAITITAHVDVSALRFVPQDGRRVQHLTFVAALLDTQGKLVTAKEGAMDLELTDATFAGMAASGLNANLSLAAPPGTYRLREVVQESVDGRIATTLQTVEIPGTRQ